MSSLETVALVLVTAWLALISLLVLLLVRQVGLITVRLDRARSAGAPVADGLAVGDRLPSEVTDRLAGTLADTRAYLLVLGAVCQPCRQLLDDLRDARFDAPVHAVVSGSAEHAEAVLELVPETMQPVREPAATAIVRALEIESTPFVFEVRDGQVTAKAMVRGAEHFLAFIDEGAAKATERGRPVRKEVKLHV
jgi:hypothetical protein